MKWSNIKYLVLRRVVQIGLLFLYFAANAWGWKILEGNLSTSRIFDMIPMSDPYAVLQMLAAGAIISTDIFSCPLPVPAEHINDRKPSSIPVGSIAGTYSRTPPSRLIISAKTIIGKAHNNDSPNIRGTSSRWMCALRFENACKTNNTTTTNPGHNIHCAVPEKPIPPRIS